MFSEYVNQALKHAEYEKLEDGTWYGEVPDLKYTWANAPTLEECRQRLKDEVEDWLVFAIAHHHSIPTLDGVNIEAPVAP